MASDSGQRPWEPDLSAIGCAAVVRSSPPVLPDTPSSEHLLPVPGRSSASRPPTPFGHQSQCDRRADRCDRPP
ncbi:hypothetical protein D3M70_28125 [Pseudomonas sp. LS-2]|nr:hypothetical protein D3M70_28125 [Pseudomonas sp. LS-2]